MFKVQTEEENLRLVQQHLHQLGIALLAIADSEGEQNLLFAIQKSINDKRFKQFQKKMKQ